MSPRKAAWALAAVALVLWAHGGLSAFDTADTGARASAASVVATGSAYDGIATTVIHSPLVGIAAQEGVRVYNNGTVPTTFTWTTTSDPGTVVISVAGTCGATATAVGTSCTVLFTVGPKAEGTYTVTGKIAGTDTNFRSSIPGITVTVKYCVLPPC